jgi:hypothetical protein
VNGLETYGPPAGAETVSASFAVQSACANAGKVVEAGPECASVTVFSSAKLPAVPPWYQTSMPATKTVPAGATAVAAKPFAGSSRSMRIWVEAVSTAPAWPTLSTAKYLIV